MVFVYLICKYPVILIIQAFIVFTKSFFLSYFNLFFKIYLDVWNTTELVLYSMFQKVFNVDRSGLKII